MLTRVERPKIGQIWLFSRETLAAVPELFDEVTSTQGESFVARAVRGTGLRGGWLDWLSVPVAIALFYLGTLLLNRLLRPLLGWLWRRMTRGTLRLPADALPVPARLLLVALVGRWIIATLPLSGPPVPSSVTSALRPSARLPARSSHRKMAPSFTKALSAPRWIWSVTVSEASPGSGAPKADATRTVPERVGSEPGGFAPVRRLGAAPRATGILSSAALAAAWLEYPRTRDLLIFGMLHVALLAGALYFAFPRGSRSAVSIALLLYAPMAFERILDSQESGLDARRALTLVGLVLAIVALSWGNPRRRTSTGRFRRLDRRAPQAAATLAGSPAPRA